MEFHGRHIVVTGAANGIGRALARRFHAEGARVVASDREPHGLAAVVEELNSDRADSAIEFPVDIGTESGNRELVAAAEAAFGPIDLFFANAGVAIGTDLETTEAAWELAFDVNVHAHRWAAKYLLPSWPTCAQELWRSLASDVRQAASLSLLLNRFGGIATSWQLVGQGYSLGFRDNCSSLELILSPA